MNPTTRIIDLTVSELESLIQKAMNPDTAVFNPPEKEYVRGLKAIADVLKISVRQVSRIKDTVLAPAIMQRCRTIKGDKQLLLELHNEYLKKSQICG